MIDLSEKKERVILFGISESDYEETSASLDELKELAQTAGADAVATVIQRREAGHPATYLGKGKIDELKDLIWENEATGVICDDELSPAQLKNLEAALDTKVMDRTMVILDIFAARASSKEGKLQVELAQLKYRSARLVGLRSSLSRLGGGIGTRGPGEKKLEMDRRLIHERISKLKEDLQNVERHRDVTRSLRGRSGLITAALMGYTNAGKSSLLNTLTGADVLSEDKLFATLDPTTRILKLPDDNEILLTDTVGFIHKLPHHLIEAFKSTLDEVRFADVLLHVVDISDKQAELKMHIVYETLHELKADNKKIITLFNKIDAAGALDNPKDLHADAVMRISAHTGEGLLQLKDKLAEVVNKSRVYLERFYRYEDAGRLQLIRKYGQIISEEYNDDGIAVTGYIARDKYHLI